jgi:hypothetical protein
MIPHNSRTSPRNKEQRGYDYSQRRTQQQRFSDQQDDFIWETEIRKVLSPYWAARSDTSGFTGSI